MKLQKDIYQDIRHPLDLDISRRLTLVVVPILTLIFVLSPAVIVFARGGGGGGGSGGHGGGGHMGEGHGRSSGTSSMGHRGDKAETRTQHSHWIGGTEERHQRYQTCLESAQRVRHGARNMSQAAKDLTFSQDQVRRQHEQLRSQIRTMEEEHQQFMGTLSNSQRKQMRDRIQKMDRARNGVNTHFQRMDQEISRPNFDRKHIAQQVGDMDKSMKEWQKQYQKVGSDLGVEP